MMEWSAQQSKALQAIDTWLNTPSKQVFRLFGYAGSGKTTLAREVEQMVMHGFVQYAAFTGKAASVLRDKGCHNASTIHSLIYKVIDGPGGTVIFELWPEAPQMQGIGLLVVDEVSMVDEKVGRDLLSFGIKVLVLGDPAQLPPVKGAGYFTDAKPDYMLTEVHRQALDSPIIRLATAVRQKETIKYGNYGKARVIEWGEVPRDDIMSADQVLCGKNKTRHALNRQIRAARGYEGPVPHPGERLICLKNDREKGLLNGTIWYLHEAKLTNPENHYRGSRRSRFGEFEDDGDFDISTVPATIDPRAMDSWLLGVVRDGEELEHGEDGELLNQCRSVLIPMPFFMGTDDKMDWQDQRGKDQFTYGYAITVHKAQGSQWNKVVLYDESHIFREDAHRHLYTGITRAADELVLVR